jgi:serine/threonine-protein kinase
MAFTPGTRIGAYEVVGTLGAGGMGEVYRGRDTRLKREVALKILPESFATDRDRLARFQREAEVLASLNHPNVAAIYGFEESHGTPALVMELVEGPTLADRIAQGPIPVDDALPIAKQIAEALEAAHEQGIIHRDLKPANIKLRPDGTVKVLDFGLAKALEPAASESANLTQSPTITSPAMMTGVGVLLGTAAYMSPEQARARPVDKRADIWAFGCVLYEMLTGQRAFGGEDVTDTLAAVVRAEPAWDAVSVSVPPIVMAFLRQSLRKNARQRLHDIADMRLALAGAFEVDTGAASLNAASKRRSRKRFMYAAAMAVLVAAAAVIGWMIRRTSSTSLSPSVVRLTATPLDGNPLNPTTIGLDIAVSPDGSRIAYLRNEAGGTVLYVRPLSQLAAVRIEGLTSPAFPFFSADGAEIGFFEAGVLKRVRTTGGPAIAITPIQGTPYGGSWGSDDAIIFATSDATGLMRVPAAGGQPTEITKPSETEDHAYPQILPGERAVLFTIRHRARPSLDSKIGVIDLQSRLQKILVGPATQARYAPSGHIVFGFAGTLSGIGFDPAALTVQGSPVQLVDGVVTKAAGPVNFAISSTGLLVYESGNSAGAERSLVWVDRQGREEMLPTPNRAYAYPRISPDGRRIALDIRDQENDIWIWDNARRGLTRFTFDPGVNRGIAWTPDGRRVAFSVERDATESVFWQAGDGTGSPERLTSYAGRSQVPISFSPDGTRLVFNEPSAPPFDLYLLNLDADRKVTPLLKGPRSEHNAEISPDGRWLAYQSDESGSSEVYVRPFPNISDGRWPVSTDGGTRPAWARNGGELFYLKADGTMVAVPVKLGTGVDGFSAGIPQALFKGQYFMTVAGRTYDVSADGRFLMIKNATPAASASDPQLVVVLNWQEELKRLVPVN